MKKKIFDGWRLYARKSISKIKEIIGIGKFDDARALIGIDDKLRDEVNLKKCSNINYVSYKRL